MIDNKFAYLAAVAVGLLVGFFVGYGVAGAKGGVVHGESTKILAANGAKIEKATDGKIALVLPADNIQTPKLRDGQVKIILKNKGE